MKVVDMARLKRMERIMIRWMCGVHLKLVPYSTVRLALNALQVWLDEADCSGLVILRESIVMIGFRYVDVLKLTKWKTWHECVKKDSV